jgi:signal peptidase II
VFREITPVSIVAYVLILDQAAKFFLTHSLTPNETIPVVNNIFHITLVFNTGCAFGLFKNIPNLYFLSVSSAAVILLLCLWVRMRKGDAVLRLSALLIIAGALSNMIDRARFGYVIDFLDFRIWPVFNIGDSAITVGVIIFAWKLIYTRA